MTRHFKRKVTQGVADDVTIRDMDEGWRNTREFADRLRWARIKLTPFDRAKSAAESLGIKPGTYRTYERRGPDGREPPLEDIQRIARKFKVSWAWLATGEGGPKDQFLIEDERIDQVRRKVAEISGDKQEDAVNAAIAVLDSYIKRAS